MLEGELIDLINALQLKKCEMQTLELKKAKDGYPKKLYDTLSAFSNQSGGGILLFGIDEQNNYTVCGVHDELTPVIRSSPEALDSNKLSTFYMHIQTQKPNLAHLPKEEILKLQGITSDDIPTVTGIMLFGLYPQAYFPQLSIISIVVPGYELGELGMLGERFIDNKRIEGTIPQMLEQALQFVLRNIQYKTIINPLTGKREDMYEYPIRAIREILLNALVHRDYSVHTENSPIRIMLFKNRLEIENPGGLYGRLTLDSLGKISGDTRNPYMANILEVLGETENRFSGIPTIYKEMEKYNLKAPEFISQRGNFKVILYNTSTPQVQLPMTNMLSTTQNIINFCSTPRSREELAAFLNIQTPSYAIKIYIQPLIEQGLLKMTLPSKPKSKNQKYVAV